MRALLSTVCLLAAACGGDPAPAGLSDADKAAVQKATADAELRFNAQPADFKAHAMLMYSADAVFMPPNLEPVQGAEAIGNWMAAYPAINNAKFSIVSLDGSGEIAYVQGAYEMDITPPGATVAVHDKGKYLEVWRKQSDGSWKVVLDMFNSDLPVAMQATGRNKK